MILQSLKRDQVVNGSSAIRITSLSKVSSFSHLLMGSSPQVHHAYLETNCSFSQPLRTLLHQSISIFPSPARHVHPTERYLGSRCKYDMHTKLKFNIRLQLWVFIQGRSSLLLVSETEASDGLDVFLSHNDFGHVGRRQKQLCR